MTTPAFPSLPLAKINRTPIFRNLMQLGVTPGMETAIGLSLYPGWKWEIDFIDLRADSTNLEFQTVIGFVLGQNGTLNPFLFTDPLFCSATDQQFATGDGVTTVFQLLGNLGTGSYTYLMPLQSINAITNITVNGVATSAYTIDSTGIVTFTSAPANGLPLTWSGSYNWQCRLGEDESATFEQVTYNLLKLKTLAFQLRKK